jgi:hypothetical protein
VAQDRAGEFGEETLDEVEPGAVFGCEGELEAAHRFSGEPSLGFSGDMRRMVVQDQLDRCSGLLVLMIARECRVGRGGPKRIIASSLARSFVPGAGSLFNFRMSNFPFQFDHRARSK